MAAWSRGSGRERIRRGRAGSGPRDGRDRDRSVEEHVLEADDTAGGGVPRAYRRSLVRGDAKEVGPEVGGGCGEVDEGGVAAVGAGGGSDERRVGEGRVERPRGGWARGACVRRGRGEGGWRYGGGVPVGGPRVAHVQGWGDPEGVMTLAGEGGEPAKHRGKGGGEECGGQRPDGLGGVQQGRGASGGRGVAKGSGRGRRSAEWVHPGQRSRAGRRREPQWRQMRGARSGGGAHG